MRVLSTGLLLLTLTACGAAAPATDNDSTGAAPSAVASPAVAAPAASEPAALPSAAAGFNTDFSGGSAAPAGDVAAQAAAFLATQINTAAADLELQNREAVEWSDSSLGCPDPATMYMQVITPGYKLTYTDGTQTYTVHTNEDGSTAVLCDNGAPRVIGQP